MRIYGVKLTDSELEKNRFTEGWKNLIDGRIGLAIIEFVKVLNTTGDECCMKTIDILIECLNGIIQNNDIDTFKWKIDGIIRYMADITTYLSLVEKYESVILDKIDECNTLLFIYESILHGYKFNYKNQFNHENLDKFRKYVSELNDYKNYIYKSTRPQNGIESIINLINSHINPLIDKLNQSIDTSITTV
jgi:hypothetical protein